MKRNDSTIPDYPLEESSGRSRCALAWAKEDCRLWWSQVQELSVGGDPGQLEEIVGEEEWEFSKLSVMHAHTKILLRRVSAKIVYCIVIVEYDWSVAILKNDPKKPHKAKNLT